MCRQPAYPDFHQKPAKDQSTPDCYLISQALRESTYFTHLQGDALNPDTVILFASALIMPPWELGSQLAASLPRLHSLAPARLAALVNDLGASRCAFGDAIVSTVTTPSFGIFLSKVVAGTATKNDIHFLLTQLPQMFNKPATDSIEEFLYGCAGFSLADRPSRSRDFDNRTKVSNPNLAPATFSDGDTNTKTNVHLPY